MQAKGISKLSMPCIGTRLDQLDWDNELFNQGTFRTSPVQVVVYLLPNPETKHGDLTVEKELFSEFARA